MMIMHLLYLHIWPLLDSQMDLGAVVFTNTNKGTSMYFFVLISALRFRGSYDDGPRAISSTLI